jgi:hypothetical protein
VPTLLPIGHYRDLTHLGTQYLSNIYCLTSD